MSNLQPHIDDLNSLVELFNEGQFPEVEVGARRLVSAFPLSGNAWSILGASLQAQKKQPLAALKRAVSLLPEDALAHRNLGVALEQVGHLEAAMASYSQSLLLNPSSADTHCHLAQAQKKVGRLNEAIESYRSALSIDGTHYQANHGLYFSYRILGRLVDAEELCRRTLALKPDFEEMSQNLSNTLAYLSNHEEVVKESNAAFQTGFNQEVMWEQRLYCFSYHPDLTAEEILDEFVRWGDRLPLPTHNFATHDHNPNRRLRIGYVSPDFRKHSSRFYFWPLFLNHDKESFELFAYSSVQEEVAWTRLFRGQFEHWREIQDRTDEAAAHLIREDGIDILVDLCGHMDGDRLGLFALKPAPIQATWLGSAWTTGLKAMDYALFDPFTAPEGTLTRETIIHLPNSYFAFQPRADAVGLEPPPCLKNGYVTFGYTGRTERLNHKVFLAWGELLKRLPGARLILDFKPFGDPRTQAYYRTFLTQHGVDTERVILRKSTNICEGLNDIDILLDSFPHSGGTMLMDAFWMGVPAVTLASRPPVGRLGTSMLINLGLPEWVAATEAEYIEKACGFAGDFQALSELRLGMRRRMQNSPLMDGPGFARGVESAFRVMFERWLEENPPSLDKVGGNHSLEPGGTP